MNKDVRKYFFILGLLGNMEAVTIHCLTDIINIYNEQRMGSSPLHQLFLGSSHLSITALGLRAVGAMLGYCGYPNCSNSSFDVMKCVGRYFG